MFVCFSKVKLHLYKITGKTKKKHKIKLKWTLFSQELELFSN